MDRGPVEPWRRVCVRWRRGDPAERHRTRRVGEIRIRSDLPALPLCIVSTNLVAILGRWLEPVVASGGRIRPRIGREQRKRSGRPSRRFPDFVAALVGRVVLPREPDLMVGIDCEREVARRGDRGGLGHREKGGERIAVLAGSEQNRNHARDHQRQPFAPSAHTNSPREYDAFDGQRVGSCSVSYGWPATFTGTLLSVIVPLPSAPAWFEPQQYARLVVVTPHVCPPALLTEANVRPPCPATGEWRSIVVPSPSLPELEPQQYAAPLVVTPHVCSEPALIEANISPPATRTGMCRSVVEVSPSWPQKLAPQQYAAPLVVMPQA